VLPEGGPITIPDTGILITAGGREIGAQIKAGSSLWMIFVGLASLRIGCSRAVLQIGQCNGDRGIGVPVVIELDRAATYLWRIWSISYSNPKLRPGAISAVAETELESAFSAQQGPRYQTDLKMLFA
jgi:hypothetical protein